MHCHGAGTIPIGIVGSVHNRDGWNGGAEPIQISTTSVYISVSAASLNPDHPTHRCQIQTEEVKGAPWPIILELA